MGQSELFMFCYSGCTETDALYSALSIVFRMTKFHLNMVHLKLIFLKVLHLL